MNSLNLESISQGVYVVKIWNTDIRTVIKSMVM